jgi:hypothetical protein
MGFSLLANVSILFGSRHMGQVEDMRNPYKILVRNHEGINPNEKPWLTREDNIEIDLQKLSTYRSDWPELAQTKIRCLALVNTAVDSIKCSEFLDKENDC